MRNIFLILVLLVFSNTFAQELNCSVVVNAQQTGNENVQVFKTLERQLNEFVNNTTWTNNSFKPQERINCSMVINVREYNNESFSASIQVSSSRPIYNSSYSSPVYNYNDKEFKNLDYDYFTLAFSCK